MKVEDALPGAIIEADDGFWAPESGLRCFRPGEHRRIQRSEHGLYVRCRDHYNNGPLCEHYLDLDNGKNLIGFTLVRKAPSKEVTRDDDKRS